MRNFAILFGACAALVLAGCDTSSEDNTLNIGVVMPLTGTLESSGSEVTKGIELARDEINDSGRLGDTKLAFLTEDNASTVDGSAAAFNKLINEDRVPVIVGPVTSSATSRIASIVDGAGTVALSPTSAASGLSAKSSWLFRSSLTVERVVPAGITVSKRHLNYKRVATIHNSGDTFSSSSHAKVTEVLSADADITIVAAESYSRPPGTVAGDLTAALTAIRNSNPDAIFVSGLPEDHVSIITQGDSVGIAGIPYIVPFLAIADVKRIEAQAAGAAEKSVTFQIWLSSSNVAESKAFVQNYTARHGEVPSDWEARGYAAMQILGEALAIAKNYEAVTIQQALAETRALATIFGSFSFDENGDAIYDPIVARVQGTEFVVME